MGQGLFLSFGATGQRKPGRSSLLTCTALASSLALGVFLHATVALADDDTGGNGGTGGNGSSDAIGFTLDEPGDALIGLVTRDNGSPTEGGEGGDGAPGIATDGDPGTAGSVGPPPVDGGPGENARGFGGNGGAGGAATGGDVFVDIDVGGNILDITQFDLTGGGATGGEGGAGGNATGAKGGDGGFGSGGAVGDGGDGILFLSGVNGGAGGSGDATGGTAGAGGAGTGGNIAPIDVDVAGNVIDAFAITMASGAGQGGAGANGGNATAGEGGVGGFGGNGPGTQTQFVETASITFGDGGAGGAGGSASATGGDASAGGAGAAGTMGPVTIDVAGNMQGFGYTVRVDVITGTGGNGGNGGIATAGKGGNGREGAGGAGTAEVWGTVEGDIIFGEGGAGGAGGAADATGGAGGAGGMGTGGNAGPLDLTVGGNLGSLRIDSRASKGTGGTGGNGGTATAGTGGAGGVGFGGGGTVNDFIGLALAVGGDIVFGAGGAGGAGGSANALGGDGGSGGTGTGGSVGPLTFDVAGTLGSFSMQISGGEGEGGAGGDGGDATAGTGGVGGVGKGGGGFISSILPLTIEGDIFFGPGGAGGAGGDAHAQGGDGGAGADGFGGSVGPITLSAAGVAEDSVLGANGGKGTGGAGGDGGAAIGGLAGAGGAGGNAGEGAPGANGAAGSVSQIAGQGGAGGRGQGGSISGITVLLGSNETAEIKIGGTGGEGRGGAGGAGHDVTGANAQAGLSANDVTGGAGGAGGAGDGGDYGPVVVRSTGVQTDTIAIGVAGGIGRGGAGGLGGAADAGNGGAGLPGGGAGGNGGGATAGAGGAGGDATGGDVTVDVGASGTNTGGNTLFSIGATGGDAFGGTGGASAQAMAGSGGAGSSGANGGTGQAGFAGGAGGDGGDATGGNGGAGGDATGGTASVKVVNDGTYFSAGPVFNITATGGAATAGAGGEGGAANGPVSGDGGAGGEGGNGGDSGNGGAGGDAGSGGAATAGDGGKGGDAQGGDATVEVTNNGTIQSTDSAIVIQATGGGATAGNGGAGGFARGNSNANGGAGGDGMPAGGVGGTGGAQGSLGDVLGGSSIGGNATGGNADVTVANNGTILAAGDGIQITTELGPATAGGATRGTAVSTRTSQPGDGGNPDGSQGPFDDGGFITAGGNETPGLAELGTSTVIVKNAGTMDVDGAAVRVRTVSSNTSVLVNNSGTMQGGLAGVMVQGSAFGPLNQVKVVNSGFLSADELRAVDVKNAIAHVVNTGTLKGFVDFEIFGGNVIDNNGGVFEARRDSRFGNGDVINNNGGLIHTAEDPDAAEQVSFLNLGVLNNNGGVISLVDGGADTIDTLFMAGNTAYNSTGGVLAVDAFLAADADGGKSDKLEVIGGSTGVTTVVVNLTNPVGSTPNTEGIPLAFIPGSTHAGDFVPAGGVINAGFFAWDIKLSPQDFRTHLLYTTGLGSGAYEFAAGTTAAQDIWQQTVGSLLQRQADLRALIGNALVTPVADFAEPVEPTAVSRVTPGLWARVAGSHIERDGDVPDPLSTDREQDIWGFFAGFDFGTENVREQGDALLFGLLGGYTTSDLDFDQTGDEWDFEGPSIGAYATYLDHQFFIDAIVKADFLSIDIDADNIAPGGGEADTDAVNIGGQIDTGYKLLFDTGMFVEPQASLSVVHTEIDDVDDIFGGAVDFDDETRVSGRLGLRLGHEMTTSGGTVYSGDVTASVWQIFTGDNDVTIEAPLWPSTNLSDDPGETYGDVSLGLSMLSPDGWSSFLRANYLFAEDYEAVTGNVGVRIAW